MSGGESNDAYAFGILGQLTIHRHGVELDLHGSRPRDVLADLLLHVGRPVSVDRLINDVWEGNPPASARAALQMHVSALRRSVSSKTLVESTKGGYRLAVAADQVDAVRFEHSVAVAREKLGTGDAPGAGLDARQAL